MIATSTRSPASTASCCGRPRPPATCTPHPPFPAASPGWPAATKSFTEYASPMATKPCNSPSAAVAGERLVVGGRDKKIHCVNLKTGKAIWTYATRARVDSSPAIAGDRVYAGSNDGHFYVLDLATGKKLWDFEAGAPLSASPAIAAGRIVIGAQDGRIYCFGGDGH